MSTVKYHNPPVFEVDFEIRFAGSIPGALANPLVPRLIDALPDHLSYQRTAYKVREIQMTSPADSGSTPQKVLAQQVILYLPEEDRFGPRGIIVYPGSVAFFAQRSPKAGPTTKPYGNWEHQVLPMLKIAMPAVCDIYGGSKIDRIGLRYLNEIDVSDGWDGPSPWLPDRVVQLLPGVPGKLSELPIHGFDVASRMVLPTTDAGSQVQFETRVATSWGGDASIKLDIDVATHSGQETIDVSPEAVLAIAEQLHRHENSIFNMAVTAHAREELFKPVTDGGATR